eukprot:6178377-Pleurochrysis_carterae.AAC.4
MRVHGARAPLALLSARQATAAPPPHPACAKGRTLFIDPSDCYSYFSKVEEKRLHTGVLRDTCKDNADLRSVTSFSPQ